MTTQWGRKETIVWPPHAPIYTYTALLSATICLCLFGLQQLRSLPTLQHSYITEYLRASVGAQFQQSGKYDLIYVSGAKQKPRLALPADFVPGHMTLPDGRMIDTQFSDLAVAQGFQDFRRGKPQSYVDASLARWLRGAIYDGKGLVEIFRVALFEGTFVLILFLVFAVRYDVARFKQLKYGRRLRGPILVTPAEFNKTLKGEGIGIQTDRKGTVLKLPLRAEAKHIQIMGDTGTGKSTLLMQMLQQIEHRGESAIVYDPAGEFTERFYSPKRGDWILNPLDARSPYWTPASELRNPAEARTIATSLYQPTNDKKGEFFTETPQKIFAHLLKYRPSPQELVAWMSNEDEIDRRVEGTELAQMIAKGAQQQRSGVLGSLGLIADSLRLLPTKAQAKGREWSANEWSKKREGWIFLTSTENTQEALRPLHSLWLDSLVLRLLTTPQPGQRRAWFVIDELASLQRLPQFHTALTKGRKSNNPIIFGYQGKAQLEVIYGHLAEVMLSQPSTKFVLKTAEPKAAKWASELIGEIEIERVRETVADGKRQGKSFMMDRQIEPLVMSSEIEGLDDLHSFVKLGNYVSRFSFPPMELTKIAEGFELRPVAESDLWFDPLHPNTAGGDAAAPAPQPTQDVNALALKPDRNGKPTASRELIDSSSAAASATITPQTASQHSRAL